MTDASRLPRRLWDLVRAASTLAALALVATLLLDAPTGLDVLWGVVVPLLPVVWVIAPGLWRNVCPLASTNQLPRRLGRSRGRRAPGWFREAAPMVGIGLFVTAVASRPVVLDGSGPASAALVGGALLAALVGGVLLLGKSGWCSSVCPLLPVQRLYGQAPAVTIANTQCTTCLGCTSGCYDVDPRAAMPADLTHPDPVVRDRRVLFAGVLPALVVAYFTQPAGLGTGETYVRFGLAVLAGAGTTLVLVNALRAPAHLVTAAGAATAFALHVFWATPVLLEHVAGAAPDAAAWTLRTLAWAALAFWGVRTLRTARAYGAGAAVPAEEGLTFGDGDTLAAIRAAQAGAEVTFADGGERVVATTGQSLLDVAERAGRRIESGCRMGVCGADPVCVVEGAEHLSAPTADERATLDRLGHGPRTRMACCAKVRGPVTVALEPDHEGAPPVAAPVPGSWDPAVERVVVVGNGIAGVTTAEHVRRRHPTCTIDVVAEEPHPLYNRMGIARLLHGRSAMVGLQLLPDGWDEQHRCTTWLNTRAVHLDRDRRVLLLGTGEELAYDRLVLATGAQARVAAVAGWGLPGTSVLRRADDALALRTYAQRHGARTAVVSGGGLLGLEAADALRRLGLSTTVLERGPWLLRRQLDERAAAVLRRYLEGLGISVLVGAELAAVQGEGRAARAVCADGRTVDADVVVAATGIVPDTALAVAAGLEVRTGVVVDDTMRTSDPHVFAVGDVAEHRGVVLGLWPAGAAQAEVAAAGVVGAAAAYTGTTPVTMLKVVGIEVLSCGRIVETDDDEVVVHEDVDDRSYAKLVVRDGRLAGAVLVGHGALGAPVSAAVKAGADVGPLLGHLHDGDLDVLAEVEPAAEDTVLV